MKRLWRKPAVKISMAAVIVVGLGLIGLWIWSLRTPPVKTFKFLAGRDITTRIEKDPGKLDYRVIRDIYSFEADFNDVLEAAEHELLALGYSDGGTIVGVSLREYWITDVSFQAATLVIIRDRKESPNLQLPMYLRDDGPWNGSKEGWVNVEIRHWHLRSWPPQHLLFGLKMRLQTLVSPIPPSVWQGPNANQKKP